MSQIAAVPTDRPEKSLPAIAAGGTVRAIVPQTFDDAYRIARAVVAAQLAPKGLDTPEQCLIAIMHGAEVGLPPMQALQSIAIINGRPSIWGDGALGLVRGSGLLEWIEETSDGTTAICRTKRVGEPKPVERSFSDEDAKAAGLFNKAGPWTQYRRRMRQMRARSWCLRDGFADVLRGLHIAEEAQDIGPMKDVTPPPAPPPAPAAATLAPPAPPAAEAKVVEAVAEPVETPPKLLPPSESQQLKAQIKRRLYACDTTVEIEAWAKEWGNAIATLQPAHRGEIQDEWEAMSAEYAERESPSLNTDGDVDSLVMSA